MKITAIELVVGKLCQMYVLIRYLSRRLMNSAGSLELLKMVPQSVSATALEIEPIWISLLGLGAKF